MSTKFTIRSLGTAIATALLAVTGAAQAQEATSDDWMKVASTQSRAEVRAEAIRFRDSGELAAMDDPILQFALTNPRLRAEIVAELLQARANGQFAAMQHEAHDFWQERQANVYALRRPVQVAGR